jgi:hypothetical protein
MTLFEDILQRSDDLGMRIIGSPPRLTVVDIYATRPAGMSVATGTRTATFALLHDSLSRQTSVLERTEDGTVDREDGETG